MDLIATLSSQLGLAPNQAEGLAGGLLGKLEEQVSAKLGGADAAALRSGLPELEGWKAKAAALGAGEGGGGGLGGLLGAAGGLLGGATGLGGSAGGLDLASLVQLASKVGLSPGAAQSLVPVVLSFLQARLDPALLSRVLSAVPALSKLAGNKGGSGGGLLGALGGILGG